MSNPHDGLITKVKLLGNHIIRPNVYTKILERHKPKLIQTLPEYSFWQRAKLYGRFAVLLVKILPFLIKIRISLMSGDFKTTIAGGVKVLFLALTVFGINTGHITEALVTTTFYAVADLVQAWYTNKK